MAIVEGGCLCGAIRYRFTAEPRARSLCHCRTCQRAAGAPSVAWLVLPAAHFTFTSGTPTVFSSTPGILRTFCGRCGTSLTYQREAEPQTIDVTTASLDLPNDFPPAREIWLSHKLVWERANEAVTQYPQSSRGAV